ncbi:glycosyltransferase family 2 protein [Hydrogenimonas cancrithermarum]|uniref:Glycosyl transferase n=1 Tax=Hydrogenimonas cancrithermarum TaxID=2993563 RepID=A0ABM8FMF3_9BACT|nr:glycosyltransferase family 2 protein [Hydrogenimonas cancrithermarum]BDY13572.1 glycosyl transferase [Hydrogenimonas cancrithermarum]
MTLSIIVPCYNEEEVLPETVVRLSELLQALIDKKKVDEKSRICFVDDGSKDATWKMIERYSTEQPNICGIKLSRNYGHQNALIAGLFNTDSDIAITIDADLQDDISVIERMIDEYYRGNEIVYGVRKKRDTDTWFKRMTAESFYKLMQLLGVNVVYNHADFRLMSRNVIEHLKEFKEVNLFLRAMIPLIGFKQTSIYYDRSERMAGETKYPLKKMLAFAWEGITSFSIVPLRFITFVGFVIFFFSILMSLWILGIKLFTDSAVPGWASTVLPIYLIGGIQVFSVGIVGEYIGKIYMETKSRPRFIIERTLD